MPNTEQKLKAICSELRKMDETELMRLLPLYHRRLEQFESIGEWEEATLIFFLINGIRIKNIQMPEKVSLLRKRPKGGPPAGDGPGTDPHPPGPPKRPSLRLIK
jgi:hypothetical protein